MNKAIYNTWEELFREAFIKCFPKIEDYCNLNYVEQILNKTDELEYHSLLCNDKKFAINDDFTEIAKQFNLDINRVKEIIKTIEKVAN